MNRENIRSSGYVRAVGIAWSHVHAEYRHRILNVLRSHSDTELASTLRALMRDPSSDFTPTEQVLRDVVEQAIAERHPAAGAAVEEYIDGLDVDNLPADEYTHLRLLLDVAGL